MKKNSVGLLKRLVSAVASHEVDPIVTWWDTSEKKSSEEILRFNNALFCLTGADRLHLTLDLLDLVVRGDTKEILAVFGSSFKRPVVLEYRVNNFGGVVQSLHVGDLFSVTQSTALLGHRPNWRMQRGKISLYHTAILSAWKWEDHTRFDDNRQEDNIRFSMLLPVLCRRKKPSSK